jgi:hypothetical protein
MMYHKLDFINEYFQFIDGNRLFTAFELLQVMDSVKNEWNYTGALIDPYNSLSTDQKKLGKTGMHEYHYEVASALRVFAHQNNVTTIVNAHPVTEAMRKVFYKGHQVRRVWRCLQILRMLKEVVSGVPVQRLF